jgi:hypothetical protein
MTVKELLTSITFEEVATALRRTHHYDNSIREMASYKEAYDVICHTEFNGEGGEVTFDITEPKEKAKGSLPVLVNNVEGDYWENTIGKSVIFPDNKPFTNAELAGAILWGMTFYGFSHLKRWTPGVKPFGKYGEKAQRLWRKLYLPYLRNKKEIARLKRCDFYYNGGFSWKVWKEIKCHQEHQNRSKRKRYYRIENRIDYLERMANRDELLTNLFEMIGEEAETLRPQIMTANKMQLVIRESRTYGKMSRIDYLVELITHYNGVLWEEYEDYRDMIVVVTTSLQNLATAEEKQSLTNLFSEQATKRCINLKFIHGIEPSLPKAEMNLRFIIVK